MYILPHEVLVQVISDQWILGLCGAIINKVVTFAFVQRPVWHNKFVLFPKGWRSWILRILLNLGPEHNVLDYEIARSGSLAKAQTCNLCIWYHIHKVLGSQLINLQTDSSVVECNYHFLPSSKLKIQIGLHIVGYFRSKCGTSTCLALCHNISCRCMFINFDWRGISVCNS